MNRFAMIVGEFLKIAIENDWWKKMPRHEQLQYIKQHRKTKLRPTLIDSLREPVDQQLMGRIFKSVPPQWKKELTTQKIGINSITTQLSDALRSRQLKDAFDNADAVAIVGFKSGTPITKMSPEFIILKSYEDDKYSAQKIVPLEDGKLQIKPIAETRERYRSRGWRRGSYTEQKRELRMSKIVELLEDKAYTVFAIQRDDERMKLRQQRSDSADVLRRRSIEQKLLKDAVQPIYNYYSDRLNSNISKLQEIAVPQFDDILRSENYTGGINSIDKRQVVTQGIIDNIKQSQDKLSSLGTAINSFKSYRKLPLQDTSYSEDNYNRREFMKELNILKDRFKAEKAIVIKSRLKEAVAQLSSVIETSSTPVTLHVVVDNASDLVQEVGLKDLSDKIQQLKLLNINDRITKTDEFNEIYKQKLDEILSDISEINSQQESIIQEQRRY